MENNINSVLENLIKGVEVSNVDGSNSKNAEVEGGEKKLGLEGNVTTIEGDKHKDGGVDMSLNNGDRILSDKLKPSKDQRNFIEDFFSIKINNKHTYSDILTKIEKRIGLNDIIDEQESYIKKLNKNTEIKDDNTDTKSINQGLLNQKLKSLQLIRSEMDSFKKSAFDSLYNMQEINKESKSTKNSVANYFEEGGEMVDKGYSRPQISFNGYDNNSPLNKRHSVWLIPKEKKGSTGAPKNAIYNPTTGGYEIDGKAIDANEWNAMTKQGADWFYSNASTFASVDKGYADILNKRFKDTDFSKMSSEEIKKTLNSAQQERQDYFTDNYSNLSREVALTSYQPTEQGINEVFSFLKDKPIASLTKEEANFINYVKSNDLIGDSGKVKGGFFTQQEGRNTEDFYNIIRGLDNTLQNKFARGQINDGVYDRRLEHFQEIDFGSISERDAYAKEFGFKQVEESDGRVFWIDSKNSNNIYVPRVFRDKKVSESEKKKWEGKDTFYEQDGSQYKNLGTPGVYDRYYTDSPNEQSINRLPIDNEVKAIEENTSIEKTNINSSPRAKLGQPLGGYPVGYIQPPGEYVGPPLISPELRDETYLKVSPEKAIVENQKSLEFMLDEARNVQNGLLGSLSSNLAGQIFEANNEAIDQSNSRNTQLRIGYDNSMSRRLDQFDSLKDSALYDYTVKAQQAVANTDKDWRDYIKDIEALRVASFDKDQRIKFAEAVTPSINWNPYRGTIEYDPYERNQGFTKK